jgi:ankyrin repeat protein
MRESVESNRIEFVQLFLEHKDVVKIDLPDKSGLTPLIVAANNGRAEIVTLLARNGADPNRKDLAGNTGMIYACWFGHYEVARALVLAGCDIELRDG